MKAGCVTPMRFFCREVVRRVVLDLKCDGQRSRFGYSLKRSGFALSYLAGKSKSDYGFVCLNYSDAARFYEVIYVVSKWHSV